MGRGSSGKFHTRIVVWAYHCAGTQYGSLAFVLCRRRMSNVPQSHRRPCEDMPTGAARGGLLGCVLPAAHVCGNLHYKGDNPHTMQHLSVQFPSAKPTRGVEAFLKKTAIAYHQNLAFLLGFQPYAIAVFFKNASTPRVGFADGNWTDKCCIVCGLSPL